MFLIFGMVIIQKVEKGIHFLREGKGIFVCFRFYVVLKAENDPGVP